MKFVTFLVHGEVRLGAVWVNMVFDVTAAYAQYFDTHRVEVNKRGLPLKLESIEAFLEKPKLCMPVLESLFTAELMRMKVGRDGLFFPESSWQGERFWHEIEGMKILAPLSHPTAITDFIAFEDHIRAMRVKRGAEVPPEWYEIPGHYRANHTKVYGPNDVIPWPSYTEQFDYELELACVIGEDGMNIPVERAHEYIAGYMIMNDWSCRDAQRQEMAIGLGPGRRSKPGASFGPWFVTADELPGLANLCRNPNAGPMMRAYVNGELRSQGRFGSIYWSFAQMIAYLSCDQSVVRGEILGSGTIGGGCGAELDRWIRPHDMVELEVEGLGRLRNRVGGAALWHTKQQKEDPCCE